LDLSVVIIYRVFKLLPRLNYIFCSSGLPMVCGLVKLTLQGETYNEFRNVVVSQPKPHTVGKPRHQELSQLLFFGLFVC
jgi:hypothetical protein